MFATAAQNAVYPNTGHHSPKSRSEGLTHKRALLQADRKLISPLRQNRDHRLGMESRALICLCFLLRGKSDMMSFKSFDVRFCPTHKPTIFVNIVFSYLIKLKNQKKKEKKEKARARRPYPAAIYCGTKRSLSHTQFMSNVWAGQR